MPLIISRRDFHPRIIMFTIDRIQRQAGPAKLSGHQIAKAMRHYNVTGDEVRRSMGLTRRRMIQVLSGGVCGLNYVRDWMEGVRQAHRAKISS